MKIKPITWLGLFISYSSITIVNWIFKTYSGTSLNNSQVIAKELIILSLVGVLFLIIIKGEKLGLDSIGINFTGWGKSILLMFVIMICTIAAALIGVLISQQVGWSFGESKAFDALSLWTITLVTIRAGVAEEVFMRGYLLERLTTISGSKWIAGGLRDKDQGDFSLNYIVIKIYDHFRITSPRIMNCIFHIRHFAIRRNLDQ